MKTVLVVARTYEDFQGGIRDRLSKKAFPPNRTRRRPGRVEINDTEYVFISSPDRMLGFKGVTVEYWTRLYLIENIDEFKKIQPTVERA